MICADFFDKVCFKRNLPGGRQARTPIAIGTGLTDWDVFFLMFIRLNN